MSKGVTAQVSREWAAGTVKKRASLEHMVPIREQKEPTFSVCPPHYQNTSVTEHLHVQGSGLYAVRYGKVRNAGSALSVGS